MLHLPPEELPPRVRESLANARDKLAAVGDYAARVADAERHWNNARPSVVNPVRATLQHMCGEAEACCYCANSIGSEVEHVRPKALYPDETFVWPNLLLICGRCNRRKNARFSILVEGELVDVTRPRGAPIEPPQAGPMALIDLRREDPLNFVELELETGILVERPPAGTLEHVRAGYTIRATLRLNDAPHPVWRRQAYDTFRARLSEIARALERGEDARYVDGLRATLLRLPQQLVWREMQRQADSLPRLGELFKAVPGAREW